MNSELGDGLIMERQREISLTRRQAEIWLLHRDQPQATASRLGDFSCQTPRHAHEHAQEVDNKLTRYPVTLCPCISNLSRATESYHCDGAAQPLVILFWRTGPTGSTAGILAAYRIRNILRVPNLSLYLRFSSLTFDLHSIVASLSLYRISSLYSP